MTNFNLNSVALLVEFNASVWTARKLDKKKTDDVVQGSGAKAKGAARVNKSLLAGRPELEEITAIVGAARTYVYDNTTPWSDNGQRLLISARFPKFNARMEGFMAQYHDKVQEFLAIYPTLITAQAMALGDMFDRNEFPAAGEIARKFGISCDYMPVPMSGDIRVDIGNQAQEELRDKLNAMSNARLDKAMGDVTTRFVEHLQRMADRLQTDVNPATGEETHRRFTDTLVSSAFDLCDLVADYNVKGDPVLAQARQQLEAALSGTTAVALRADPGKREDVQKEVKNILSKFTF